VKLARMDLRDFVFRNRSYIPIPLAFIILYFAHREGSLWLPGAILVVVGEWIRMLGVRYAGKSTRTRRVGAKVLCTSGPFAYVRNPLYIGNIIIYSGVVLIAGGTNVWMMLLISVLFFALQYGLIISLEEETLGEIFGQQYIRYKEAVPRLIPRLTKWFVGEKEKPLTWRKVLISEKRTFQTIFGFIIVLVIRQVLFL